MLHLEGQGDYFRKTNCSSYGTVEGKYYCLNCFGWCALNCCGCFVKAHTFLSLHCVQVHALNFFHYDLLPLPGMERHLLQCNFPQAPRPTVPAWPRWPCLSLPKVRPGWFCYLPHNWCLPHQYWLLQLQHFIVLLQPTPLCRVVPSNFWASLHYLYLQHPQYISQAHAAGQDHPLWLYYHLILQISDNLQLSKILVCWLVFECCVLDYVSE